MASLRAEISWLAVSEALDHTGGEGAVAQGLSVLDLGGGTGADAVRVANLGHAVTVVDPSPDALASLDRRAESGGVRITGVLGDAEMLRDVVAPGTVDLVLCHGVLEHVEDPDVVLRSILAVLKPGGILSLVVPGRLAAVSARMAAGDVAEAARLVEARLSDWNLEELGPRRYLWSEVIDLVENAGLCLRGVRGVRVFSDLMPADAIDAEPVQRERTLQLERQLRSDPQFAQGSGGLQTICHLE